MRCPDVYLRQILNEYKVQICTGVVLEAVRCTSKFPTSDKMTKFMKSHYIEIIRKGVFNAILDYVHLKIGCNFTDELQQQTFRGFMIGC